MISGIVHDATYPQPPSSSGVPSPKKGMDEGWRRMLERTGSVPTREEVARELRPS